jgi:hypothetical protein
MNWKMRINKIAGILILTIGLFLGSCEKEPSQFEQVNPVTQSSIKRIDSMPNLPKPFKIIDFNQLAKNYDDLVYDSDQTGKYWPLIWKDNSRRNFDQETFGIYTAMGDVRQGNENYNTGCLIYSHFPIHFVVLKVASQLL